MKDYRRCPCCKLVKPISDFYIVKGRGCSAYCKPCEIAKVVQYRSKPHVRSRIRTRQRKLRYMLKRGVMDFLGGRCVSCGIADIRVRQVNHKNGREGSERAFKGGHGGGPKLDRFYKAILSGERSTHDLDLRCANCNILYEYERGKRFNDQQTVRRLSNA